MRMCPMKRRIMTADCRSIYIGVEKQLNLNMRSVFGIARDLEHRNGTVLSIAFVIKKKES